MTQSPSSPESLSPQEMDAWLRQETDDSNKARDLRIKQASKLVEDYVQGKTTADEAMNALYEYDMRWGDALFGTHASSGASDEHILQAIDEARNTANSSHAARAKRGGSSTHGKPIL